MASVSCLCRVQSGVHDCSSNCPPGDSLRLQWEPVQVLLFIYCDYVLTLWATRIVMTNNSNVVVGLWIYVGKLLQLVNWSPENRLIVWCDVSTTFKFTMSLSSCTAHEIKLCYQCNNVQSARQSFIFCVCTLLVSFGTFFLPTCNIHFCFLCTVLSSYDLHPTIAALQHNRLFLCVSFQACLSPLTDFKTQRGLLKSKKVNFVSHPEDQSH